MPDESERNNPDTEGLRVRAVIGPYRIDVREESEERFWITVYREDRVSAGPMQRHTLSDALDDFEEIAGWLREELGVRAP